MVAVSLAGYETTTERQLYALDLNEPGDIAMARELPGPHFACFIAWDAQSATDEVVAAFVARLLDAGASYISAWGPCCERVHDIADRLRPTQEPTDSVVMTTWHDDESLEDALWFFVFNTFPDDAFVRTTRSGLGVSVGNSEWAAAIRNALRDPSAFARHQLGSPDV